MKTVIEYIIVKDKYCSGLSSKTNEFLKIGYQPLGGITVYPFDGFLCQPMVKYLEDSDEYKIQQAKRICATGRHLS